MQTHPDWQAETAHLEQIRSFIRQQLTAKIGEVRALTTEEAGINRDMWEEIGSFHDMEGISEFMQYIGQLKQNMALARFNRREIERLDRLFLSPYFARIDFAAADEPPEPCYIGITTLMDEETARVLIHDWRAPISSLFYDWEPGEVSFQSPAGLIRGHLSLKRQYRLEGGALVLMFDAGLAIHDEILQEILAGASGGHMRQIVSTIQKEQNRAIRFEDTRVLAVQGAAGSGKTAIAMHRAAYLLYRHRQTIRPENLVILSPNTLLGEYVADVLPELGEDRLAGIPFTSLSEELPCFSGLHPETASALMEVLLTQTDPGRQASLAKKTAPRFLSQLEAFVTRLSETHPFQDLVFAGQTVVSGQELSRLYTRDFRHMGMGHRLARIRLRVLEQLQALEKTRLAQKATELEEEDIHLSRREARAMGRGAVRQELQRLRDELDQMTMLSPVQLYLRFLEQTQDPGDVAHTTRMLGMGHIPYEDLPPLMVLALACGLIDPDTKVRHVLVDEAQDFSRIQYAVLRLLYPRAGFTLLGDENQNIQPQSGIGSLDKAAAELDPDSHACLRLNRTYRCTLPISRLADAFRRAPEAIEHFGRPGPSPELLMLPSWEALPVFLEQQLSQALARGHHTIAVLTRTQKQAEALHTAWTSSVHAGKWFGTFPAKAVTESFSQTLDGLLFLPVWLAKGLEFEEVVLLFDNRDAYADPDESGLLYTACTRALHRLTLLAHARRPVALSGLSLPEQVLSETP